MGAEVTAIDSETCLIAPGVSAPPLVCVTACDNKDSYFAKWDDHELVPQLQKWFEGETVFANAPFDLGVFMRHDRRLVQPIFEALGGEITDHPSYVGSRLQDVQMREKLLDLEKGRYLFHEDEEGNVKRVSYSLDAIARRRDFGGKHWGGREWRLKYHDLRDIPLEGWPAPAVDYADVDAELTHKIHMAQQPGHPDEGFQLRAHLCLSLASSRGLKTDNDNVERLRKQCEQWLDKLTPELTAESLIRDNGKRNTRQAVRRMIETMGSDVELTTKGSEILIDEYDGNMREFLTAAWKAGKWVSVASAACLDSGDPTLLRYGVHSKLSNMLTGAVKHIEAGTFLPIQTYFDPLKETGRTSSSGPNIQNVRQGIDLPHPFKWTPETPKERLQFTPDPRQCFVAREGYVLLACDYSGAESHTLAQICKSRFGYSKRADALNQGLDLHHWVAATICGWDYKTFEAKYNAGVDQAKRARKSAKVANFGFPGGCGAARLVAAAKMFGVFIDEYDAQQLKRDWLIAFPEMKDYFDYVSSCETDDGWYFVEHLFSKRIRGKATYTAACNSGFQGLAADGAKAAMWEIVRRQRCCPWSNLWGTYLVNFVHDEFILEVPYRKLEAAARELQQIMCEYFNRYTPDVPVHASAEAGIHWKKTMAPVFGLFDESGALIPGTEEEYGWHEAHPLAA